jgi:hypothetical protein
MPTNTTNTTNILPVSNSSNGSTISNESSNSLGAAALLASAKKGPGVLEHEARIEDIKARREATKGLPRHGKHGVMARGNNLFNGKKPSKTDRVLLQLENNTELSEACSDLINKLDIDEASKGFLFNITAESINRLSAQDIKDVSDYLEDKAGGDINKAAKIMTKNFGNSSEADTVNLLKEIHDNKTTTEDFINILNNCTKQNQNLSPTAPTLEDNDAIYTAIGAFGGIIAVLCVGAILGKIGKMIIDFREAKTRIASVEEDNKQESKQVTVHDSKPPTKTAEANVQRLDSLNITSIRTP